jgi:uncharacterized integral membrane protein
VNGSTATLPTDRVSVNRLFAVMIVVPLAVVLVALAVANRNPVSLTFDPFNPGNPALTMQLPLFMIVFLAVALGLVLGSMVTWLKQGRYRRRARRGSSEPSTSVARARS